ncbi:universal stress protein [Flexivirga caeni]|uniref:Universal stress protein n=1 Tax=Flexivirga caeni TaxID=2294115 RepID=A0A3M9MG42_9MICO|nr:universal stress protein [Flexivirga caeni]
MVDFHAHPIVVGVMPGQPPLVALTALNLARAVGAPGIHFGYADQSRYVVEEFPDGSVRHAPIDPDDADEQWRSTSETIIAELTKAVGDSEVPWHFHYLAGRPDRALTHLARAVDAAGFVIGTRLGKHHVREFLNGSVTIRLCHHQHRPVITVPLEVVDWSAGLPWQ